MTRRLGFLLLTSTVLVSGSYLLVYLSRWEWQRAMLAGLLLVIAEVALLSGLVLDRLARTAPSSGAFAVHAAERLDAVADPSSGAFRWLRPVAKGESAGVFIPILLGIGVLASALAWIAETVARRATRGQDLRRLGTALAALTPPDRLVPLTVPDLLGSPGAWDAVP